VETSAPERWERGQKRHWGERSESWNVTDELGARVQKTRKQDPKVLNLVNEALSKYDISSRDLDILLLADTRPTVRRWRNHGKST
jgi:hypothetical protein